MRPSDNHWDIRRVETLHRLIDLATSKPDTLELVPRLVEYLKAPRMSQKVARRVLQHHSGAASMMVIENIVPEVNFDLGAIARHLDSETAVFNYAILEDTVRLIIIQGKKVFSKAFNPNRVEGLQALFRPTAIEFEPFKAASNNLDLYWSMSHDVLHLRPKAGNSWDIALKQNNFILYSGWQATLYDLLIAPFETQFEQSGVKHLIFMADLALMLIPFHLLENSDRVPLGQRYRVSYCPSFALLVDALTRPKEPCGTGSLLIIADPTKTLRFVPWERMMIAGVFPAERVRVLDVSTATKEAVAAGVRDADIVHFATHGRFDSEDVARSGVALSDGQWLSLDDMQRLAFKDGALVFLSACKTARLKLAGRSTPLGIVPSLFEGGASTVIATFWEVNDLSTALVAARFYDNWLVRKLPKLDSLIEAMQWVRLMPADQARRIAEHPVDIRAVRSPTSVLAGLKKIFGPSNQISRPFTQEYYWGPFALYGAWK